MRNMSLKRQFGMCRDIRVFGIGSFVRYFLGIVGILRFCDFMNFPSHCNTLIFQSCTLCFQE